MKGVEEDNESDEESEGLLLAVGGVCDGVNGEVNVDKAA